MLLQENQFTKINNSPTQQYQKIIKHIPKQCNNGIPEENIRRYAATELHKPKFTHQTESQLGASTKDHGLYNLAVYQFVKNTSMLPWMMVILLIKTCHKMW